MPDALKHAGCRSEATPVTSALRGAIGRGDRPPRRGRRTGRIDITSNARTVRTYGHVLAWLLALSAIVSAPAALAEEAPAPVVTSVSAPTISAPLAPTTARPPAGSLPGIDVSHYQGTIDWAQVSASGVRFAIAKATDGR